MNDSLDLPPITTATSGSVAKVTFNRSEQRNPLSSVVLDSLDIVLSSVLRDQNVKTIVFTGVDDVFLSGADIRELATLDPASALAFAKKGQQLIQRIDDAAQLTIAAINGYCFGGGLDFALACDLRIASPGATFAHPGARLGIITGWGGTQRLPRLLGRTRALELLLTGKRINSFQAMEAGLIQAIKNPVVEGALELAEKFNSDSSSWAFPS
jgi:enoyl-CoA hydratase